MQRAKSNTLIGVGAILAMGWGVAAAGAGTPSVARSGSQLTADWSSDSAGTRQL